MCHHLQWEVIGSGVTCTAWRLTYLAGAEENNEKNRQKSWDWVCCALWWRYTSSSPETQLVYFIQLGGGGGLIVYNWMKRQISLIRVSKSLRGNSLRLYISRRGKPWSIPSVYSVNILTWSGEVLVIPMGLEYWGPCHGCTHFNNTYSPRTSPAPYIHSGAPLLPTGLFGNKVQFICIHCLLDN